MSSKKTLNPFNYVPIRYRISLIFVLIFGVMLFVFQSVFYQQMLNSLEQDFDNALFNYAVDVSNSVEIDRQGDVDFPTLRVDDGKILPFPLGTALIQIRHKSGKVLSRVGAFGTFSPHLDEARKVIERGAEVHFKTFDSLITQGIPDAEANDYRLITFPLDKETSGKQPKYYLQIAVPMTLLERQIESRLRLLQYGLPLVILFAGLGGLFLSIRALAPISQMIKTVENMNAHQLSQRLDVPPAKDEILQLTLTLNNLFARIEKAFQSQERFVADASHQLLSPLTIVKGELESILKNTPEPQRVGILSALQEVDHLSSIVQKMLLLAKVDAGLDALNMQKIFLNEILEKAITRCSKLAAHKKINIKYDINFENTSEPHAVVGDNDLLTHLLSNLIENAIKYSPAESTVTVNLKWKKESTEIAVADQGPGLAENELENLFSRFKRGTQIDHLTKGHGLGLAIAKKIADLHSAEISAANLESGTGALFTFEVANSL